MSDFLSGFMAFGMVLAFAIFLILKIPATSEQVSVSNVSDKEKRCCKNCRFLNYDFVGTKMCRLSKDYVYDKMWCELWESKSGNLKESSQSDIDIKF